MASYYSYKELSELGLKSFGENVLISKKASIYTPDQISIGSNVRIDDFCLLVGNIKLGNYIHVSPYASIHGTGGGSVTMEDFTGLSSYCTIYASSDDYGGDYLTNPTVEEKYKKTIFSDIVLERYSTLGLHSVLLPFSYLSEGVALGAMSLAKSHLEAWGIYVGVPCRRIKERSKGCKELEKQFLSANH